MCTCCARLCRCCSGVLSPREAVHCLFLWYREPLSFALNWVWSWDASSHSIRRTRWLEFKGASRRRGVIRSHWPCSTSVHNPDNRTVVSIWTQSRISIWLTSVVGARTCCPCQWIAVWCILDTRILEHRALQPLLFSYFWNLYTPHSLGLFW